MTFLYITCFSFTSHNYEVPVFVSNTGVACARVRPCDPFNLDFLPVSYILVPNLFDDADGVDVIEENLTSTLSSVNVNLIIYDTAAMRISGFRHVSNLLALIPSKGFRCKVFNLL